MNDGGPAFPIQGNIPLETKTILPYDGMTLRDWFAGQALANVASERFFENATAECVARECYEIADAMLKESEQ